MLIIRLSRTLQCILLLHTLHAYYATADNVIFDLRDGNAEEEGQTSENSASCVNNYKWLYSKDGTLSCTSVQFIESRRVHLCQNIEEVQINCPLSCGRCCEDDPSYRLRIRSLVPNSNSSTSTSTSTSTSIFIGELKTCEWLGTSIRSKPEWWCDTRNNGLFVRDACPKSCNKCNSYVSLSPPAALPSLQPSPPPPYPSQPPTSSPTQIPTSSPTEHNPNLVMILTDEHNFRTISCYRDYLVSKLGRESIDVWGDATRLHTPHIDTLAAEGAMYTNFYTVAPLCTPSRASFMTGMYPAFTGDSALNHGAMDPNMKTFANVLQERGYHTGYFGKWHLDGKHAPGWGDNNSYNDNDNDNDRTFGFDENKYRFNRGHFKWIDEVEGNMAGYSIEDEWRFEGRESKHFTTDFLVDRGIEFIQRSVNKKEPFAMVLSIPDPHGPNDNRNYYRDMFNDRHFEIPQTAKKNMKFNPAAPGWNYFDLEEVPLDEVDNFVTEYENKERWQKVMRQYYGMVKCIDDNLGKLMRAIKDEGIDDDTIIVFTSDHGDLLMEHGKVNKGKPYETSAGIPFLVRFPGTIPAAKVIETAHSSVDFAPTILSLMGVPVNDTGVDFQGADGSEELLSDPSQTILTNMKYEEKIIFSIDSGKSPVWAMAQMGWYKFIVSKNGAPYLFDLLHDPDEMYNYADSYLYTDIKNKLRDSLTMALFEFDFPIAWYSDNIYFDIPACYDKRDILPLVGDTISRCSDVGTKIDFSRCKDQQNIRVHCGESCHACCKDTVGRMIVKEKVYNSCLELEADDACTWGKVKTFCPVTCNQCEEA
uniref:Sulfatase N-terminal domain-containing protein n=1 Tax=Chaetoceros debilis TaxID=122233 RepID=A0A7S3Q437_9STRA|eukprot:CAMPEP_0194100164 /NCGR_PEP_ID=MMETSP0150-20130528/1131_1 /TAXON_ID=122233 /ORGANISM="Chaetoceros debilis, Strain MM31A-1" /LENGTH=813 /DNA_ID=CAMNT_0038786495 /DNA_START=233 /DNA_END=2674 /DNA_ORIENTATION=+